MIIYENFLDQKENNNPFAYKGNFRLVHKLTNETMRGKVIRCANRETFLELLRMWSDSSVSLWNYVEDV